MDSITMMCIVTTVFILFITYVRFTRKNLPPGPKGILFFGNLFQLNLLNPHHTLTMWAKEYGDIYLITLLGQDKIIISGDKLLQEAIVTSTDAFADRPFLVRSIDIFYKRGFTISLSSVSERWLKVKKAVMASLKSYGDGLARIEMLTLECAQNLLESIDAYNQEPFDPQELLQQTMTKIIFSLIYARELTDTDARIIAEGERKSSKFAMAGGVGTELEVIPWLKYFRRKCVRELESVFEEYAKVHQPFIDEGKFQLKKDGSLLQSLLTHNRTAKREDEKLSNHELLTTLIDVSFAGMSTSSAALHSLIALCINHPNVSGSMQAEIDDVIGPREPKLADRSNMPYVNAVILELLRLISHVPTSLPHKTSRQVTLGGYTLPKGQEVWLNLWSLHHDDRYWHEPWAFKPERFLTTEGQLVPASHINRRRLMAFGAGRRVCVGENLAKSRLFILICILYQRYDILPEAEDKLPSSDPRKYSSGVVLRPINYKIYCRPRKIKN